MIMTQNRSIIASKETSIHISTHTLPSISCYANDLLSLILLFRKVIHLGSSWEIAQSVKGLLHKPEDLSLDLQRSYKHPDMVMYTCSPSTWEAETPAPPELAATKCSWISELHIQWETLSQNTWYRAIKKDAWHWHTHACIYIHKYCTHAHKNVI